MRRRVGLVGEGELFLGRLCEVFVGYLGRDDQQVVRYMGLEFRRKIWLDREVQELLIYR